MKSPAPSSELLPADALAVEQDKQETELSIASRNAARLFVMLQSARNGEMDSETQQLWGKMSDLAIEHTLDLVELESDDKRRTYLEALSIFEASPIVFHGRVY